MSTTFTGPVNSTNGFKPGTGLTITNVLGASAALNFGSIAAAASEDLTITVTGAAVNNVVSMGLPAAPEAGLVFNAFVSAANTVTIRATNITGSAVDAASATYSVVVTQVA
ncbi:MAG: hypothetical protein [Caudovirales sp. ctOwN3]|nr:MAG: hypothetical protein [Caudovirales sp. ctOwN3]